ncbi:MAG: ribosomal RNA small subunit methyltransferase A [Acidobacteria bacterium]|nr:ribosomal RNA small subunit methyltransferase A [Acidobacteriota bacterium]
MTPNRNRVDRATRLRPRARKRFGQHFLEPAWVDKLLGAIAPQPADLFVEIGPGRGALTRPLAARVRQLLAIEIDRNLAESLRARAPANLSVVTEDYLDADLGALIANRLPPSDRPVRVAGNLPYNVGSPILAKLLSDAGDGRVLSDATLLLQSEVADRLIASPGSREYGVLSVFTQLRADVRAVLALPAGAFRPVPKVRSTAVRLTFRPPAVTVDGRVFRLVVKTIFQRRRKTLLNATKPLADLAGLESADALARAALDQVRRPETLAIEELARLAEVFVSAGLCAIVSP